MATIVLYTREGCHLCDDAARLLERVAHIDRVIDIDHDAQLRERFTECVPVVEINGKVRFRGRVNEWLLRRVLEAEQ